MITAEPLLAKEIESASKEFFSEEFITKRLGSCGYFLGEGAKFLRLENPATADTLKKLAYGIDDQNQFSSYKLSIIGSKSLSVLWALAPEESRCEIESAFLNAIVLSLKPFEKLIIQRQALHLDKGGLKPILTFFFNGASWDQCPCLNATVFLFTDARWSESSANVASLANGFSETATLLSHYEAALDDYLTKAIGPFRRVPGSDELRINGVPQNLVQKLFFESAFRANQIPFSEQFELIPNEELFSKWQMQAEQCGWGCKQAAAFLRSLHRDQIINDIKENCSAAVLEGKMTIQRIWSSAKNVGIRQELGKRNPVISKAQEREHTRSR